MRLLEQGIRGGLAAISDRIGIIYSHSAATSAMESKDSKREVRRRHAEDTIEGLLVANRLAGCRPTQSGRDEVGATATIRACRQITPNGHAGMGKSSVC